MNTIQNHYGLNLIKQVHHLGHYENIEGVNNTADDQTDAYGMIMISCYGSMGVDSVDPFTSTKTRRVAQQLYYRLGLVRPEPEAEQGVDTPKAQLKIT